MSEKEKSKEFPELDEFSDVNGDEENSLVLHNDDVHTFEFVIDSLIEVCKHSIEQAEQCTYLVHYKGKCEVKKGPFDILRPMRHGLVEKGLNATICQY